MSDDEDFAIIDVGWWRARGRFRTLLAEAFAELRSEGCTVTYAEKVVTWRTTTYYNIKIEGPEELLEDFYDWMQRFQDEQRS